MTNKECTPLHFRHELKYSIHSVDDYILSHRLKNLFSHDKHADSHGIYRVSSLYFDTPYDKALREKIDGVNVREKFRLRYYNQDTSFIRLEKKMKINGLCRKNSAKMSCEQVQMFFDGKIDFLINSNIPLFHELYSKMKGQLLAPKTIVIYDREAFTYLPGNVRITIDRNLRTGLSNTDFLNPEFSPLNISDGLSVLEVKYDAFLPDIVKQAVQIPNGQSSTFSKYAACRRFD